jgi:signal transduction histidine kinase
MNSEVDRLLEKIKSAPEIRADMIDDMNSLATLQINNDLTAAYELSISAITYAVTISYQEGEAAALMNAATCAVKRRDYTEAIALYYRTLAIRKSQRDRQGIATIHTKLGNTKLRAGDYTSALEHYDTAIRLLQDSGDKLAVADLFANSGIIHGFQGNYALALKSHLQALKIFEPLNEQARMASSYTNIGFIYTDQLNYDNALKMFERALGIRQTQDDIMAVSDILVNIGLVYQGQQRYQEALEVHNRALKMRENLGDSAKLAVSYSNLGNIYRFLQENQMALDYYIKALELSQQVNDKRIMLQSYINLGELYYEQMKHTEAHRYLEAAVLLAEETGLKNQLRRAYELSSMLYAQEENYEKAYKYNLLFVKLDREVSNSEISVQMAQMSLRHEMEQNERAAEIEKVKNAELQKANDLLAIYVRRLEGSNDELNQFAHVASHDLREPLRMIHSYLKLLHQGLGDMASDTQKQFFRFALDGADRMEAMILDLLRLAKVDADPKIEPISLEQVTQDVKNNLQLLLNEKKGLILTDDLPQIKADRAQMLQLFQNIIGNGLKYNENIKPTIVIRHIYKDTHMEISLSDNGIGIPQEYREKAFQIFKRLPTERKYEGSGIGLAICKKIVDSMGGSISIEENPGGGTIFQILLPIHQ